MMNESKLPVQFDYTKLAEEEILVWAKEEGVGLVHVDYVVPFVRSDKSLVVYLFFDVDETLRQYKEDGLDKKVQEKFMEILKALKYPEDYLAEVSFVLDTKECVDKWFEGSYFYRLR